MEVTPEGLRDFFGTILPVLDERQRRLVAGGLARLVGRGGVALVAQTTGMSRNTVIGGLSDLEDGRHREIPAGRVRAPGAGRKQLVEAHPGLLEALDSLIEPGPGDDVASPLRWTEKSTATLAQELETAGFHLSPDSVGRALKAAGYRLQPAMRSPNGRKRTAHRQLRHIAGEIDARLGASEPVVLVDMAKNSRGHSVADGVGPARAPKLAATESNGIYALSGADGWESVGDDDVAAALAVRAVRRWWETMGSERHVGAQRLLLVPHASCPTGTRRWTGELHRLAADTGLELTVCRCPPATIRWGNIEQRLFSFVRDNRPDHPVTSYRAIVELCDRAGGGTLQERAELDEDRPARAVPLPVPLFAAAPADDGEEQWNYTVTVGRHMVHRATPVAAQAAERRL